MGTKGDPHVVTDTDDVGRLSTPSTAVDSAASSSTPGQDFSSIDPKKLMRKIDLNIVPWLSVLYLLSFLDRSAIGNARLYGLERDLNMPTNPSTQYSIAVAMFFPTYALFEIPSNVLLKKMRPSRWFPLVTILVGACMAAQGVVKSYPALVGVRVTLGAVEASLFPGCNLLMSGWYKRSQFGLRAAIFFSAATASGAFGGLLSAAIANMDGVGGYSGWRWIFILIGSATFLCGIASFWLVPDFPETAKFLTPIEREWVINRLQADQQFSAAGEAFQWRNLFQGFADWKTWVGAMAYVGPDGALYAFSLFTPTIIKQLGYTSTRANLISVPIYVVACIVTVIAALYADKHGNRAIMNLFLLGVGMIGYIVLIASRNPVVSYIFIYLAAIGVYPCVPNVIALTSTGVEGSYKRSVAMAFIWGNLNGAATTQAYASGSPWFPLGHGIVLLYLAVGFVSTVIYLLGLKFENARRERGVCDEKILLPDHDSKSSLDDGGARQQELQAATEEAARLRQEAVQKDLLRGGIRGRLRAALRELDVLPGGTYATIQEAKAKKGDFWSGFRYSY